MISKTLYFVLLLSACFEMAGQKRIDLSITHTLNGQPFAYEKKATNNLGFDIKITRLDYMLSNFTLYHDNGKSTFLDSTYFLVRNGEKFEVSFGELPIERLDSLSFLVGVDSLNNHADPALWPTGHALAPTWPDMHWGWLAGYRFAAIEGNNGPDFFYHFELHPLGDALLRKATLVTQGKESDEGIEIALQAECTKIISNINFSKVVFEHGSGKEAIGVMNNMQSNVFSVLNSSETEDGRYPTLLKAGPNPTPDGRIQFITDTPVKGTYLRITDLAGKIVAWREVANGEEEVWLPVSGVYQAEIVTPAGAILAKSTVIRL